MKKLILILLFILPLLLFSCSGSNNEAELKNQLEIAEKKNQELKLEKELELVKEQNLTLLYEKEAKAQEKAEAEAKAKVEAEAKAEAEAKVKAEAKAKAEAKSKSNIVTDTEKTYIPSKETSQYIGKVVIVCGYVVDSRYAASSTGQPTFLNFDYPYPNHTFTIVIWGQNRTNFSTPPEKKYMSKNVCIDGYIDSYKGKPQIEATSEIMITIKR